MRFFKTLSIVFLICGLVSVASADLALLKQGVSDYKNKSFVNAAIKFYDLTKNNSLDEELKIKAEYYLGLSLYSLKLYQASSYPIVKVIQSKSNKYKKKSLLKLIAISNKLGDQRMLDFALSAIDVNDIQKSADDIYYFKLASLSYDKGDMSGAINHLKTSIGRNPKNEAALNLLALSYLKKNETENAINSYLKLLELYDGRESSHIKRSYTVLNTARAYFQAKKYAQAVEFYIKIYKNSEAYRESLPELGWTYFYLGQYAKAQGVLQSLHSPFYENFFEPESLVLRAILLNYNCNSEAAEVVVNNYNSNYSNILKILTDWAALKANIIDVMAEVNYANEVLLNEKSKKESSIETIKNYGGKIPFKVTRTMLKDSRLKAITDTFLIIKNESESTKKLFGNIQNSLKPYLDSIYDDRINFYNNQIVVIFNKVVQGLEKKLSYYTQQMMFVNYEIIDEKKKQTRVRSNQADQFTEVSDRQEKNKKIKISSVSKDMKYWPFDGEFWKDEIGNTLYFGESLCVQE